jgi:hypothetical protein
LLPSALELHPRFQRSPLIHFCVMCMSLTLIMHRISASDVFPRHL